MRLSLVVPVFNEEAAIPIFVQAVLSYAPLQNYEIEIVFVDDGSRDNTAEVARSLAARSKAVKLVQLTRNFGKEAALFAGLERAAGDVVIPMDVDLQDPIEVIPEMLKKWHAGAEVVLAKRIDRSSDGHFKRRTAQLFYHIHNHISSTRIEPNVGDFRLISRPVLQQIIQLPERNLFMKGVLSWVGGKTEIVEYQRPPRSAGTSKFNTWKLWNLALEGITSFSTAPLRIWTYVGLVISLTALLYALWMVLAKIAFGNPVPGYPSLMVAIMFFGGIQIIGIGIIGEYIGRIYIETKGRPRYLVREPSETIATNTIPDPPVTVLRVSDLG